jgi:tripartite-type tricarboxylate transporter receptor subunit TctC
MKKAAVFGRDLSCARVAHQVEAHMLTRRVFLLATMAAGFGPDTIGLTAEIYPSRTIKLIVPFPPGTASEVISRIVADRLSSKFGHPIIVENRPGGAGGTVGAAVVAGAEPDGYTLLVSPPGPLVTAGTLYKNLGYDPSSSFTPVASLFSSPQLMAVHPSVPAQSIGELISYCKSNPGRIGFASRPDTEPSRICSATCSSRRPGSTSSMFPIRDRHKP